MTAVGQVSIVSNPAELQPSSRQPIAMGTTRELCAGTVTSTCQRPSMSSGPPVASSAPSVDRPRTSAPPPGPMNGPSRPLTCTDRKEVFSIRTSTSQRHPGFDVTGACAVPSARGWPSHETVQETATW
jgi:hypothetical protein